MSLCRINLFVVRKIFFYRHYLIITMYQKEVLVVYFGLIIKVIAFMWHSGVQDKKSYWVKKKWKLNSLFWFNKIQVKTYLVEKIIINMKNNLIIIKSWKERLKIFIFYYFFGSFSYKWKEKKENSRIIRIE